MMAFLKVCSLILLAMGIGFVCFVGIVGFIGKVFQ